MGKLLSFFLLTSLLGSPWAALAILIAIYWALDRSTLRYLPGPWSLTRRFFTRRQLETTLQHNPHDARSELELGRLHLEARRFARARFHLERAAKAYSTDASVQALHAVARIGAGEVEEGVSAVEALMAANPRLRFGEPWLDAGELLLARDPARAQVMLERFLGQQPSNVKALYLLGRARRKQGHAGEARAAHAKAWHEYATNPAFKRREGRVWAYRANPLRPALYAVCVFAALGALAVIAG